MTEYDLTKYDQAGRQRRPLASGGGVVEYDLTKYDLTFPEAFEVEGWHEVWEEFGDEFALAAALDIVRDRMPLPQWLYQALAKVMRSRPFEVDRDRRRWHEVRRAKAEGRSWPEAHKVAHERLQGTRFAGSGRTMKRAYLKIQKAMPTRGKPALIVEG